MNIIFAGPTISHRQVRQHLDCACLSPVQHGDILAALQQSPDAIGIIDGYFEGAPSVWHKEILYAMDQGVKVFGSASMGALRAAELCAFGMIGVGHIFESYRDGLFEDDDEVAVVHGPEEAGYIAASVPMVNIRATLEAAQEQSVIDVSEKEALLACAKSTFYKQRSWNSLLQACSELFAASTTGERLNAWLATNIVNQKRNDAIQMLQLMSESQACGQTEQKKPYFFEWTNVWETAFGEYQRYRKQEMPFGKNDQKVLDQLQKTPELYQQYRDRALLSWTCLNAMEIPVDEQARKTSLEAFRVNNQLDTRAQIIDYMEKTGLSESSLMSILTDAARVDLASQTAGKLQTNIIEQLKLNGQYIPLLEAALAGSDRGL